MVDREAAGIDVTLNPEGPYADDLFDALMALPASSRDSEAVARCGGDRSLLREVRALIRAADDPPGEPGRGDRLGRYRLDACLGRGTSAAVWSAFDEHLESWTALKLFHPGRAAASLEPVLREARAASGVLSDHVVRVKAAGRFAEGPYYIEMLLCAEHRRESDGQNRLVVGSTLAQEPATDVDEAVRLVAEAARGVDAAHRVGVIHRDVKPANILVTPLTRRALVADFGLASPVLYPAAAGLPGTASVSVAIGDHAIVGTPCFMAPEVALGQGATRASDVYGLGATLYALLAGTSPFVFAGEEVDALTVVHRVRAGAPASLSGLASDAPRRLVRVVERAMARDPARRYRSAGALADDLDAWRARLPVSVDRLRPVVATGLFVQRNRTVVAASALVVGVLVASGGTLWSMEQVRRDLLAETHAALVRKVTADVAAIRADAGRRAAALMAGEALLGAEEAARGAATAAREAEHARREVEEVTAWADTERALALEAVTRAREASAAAEARLVEMQIEVDRAHEERALARTELLAAQRRNAATAEVVEQLSASLARERAERAAVEAKLAALRAEKAELAARLAALEAAGS
jgi:serine/threonine-protein kinase